MNQINYKEFILRAIEMTDEELEQEIENTKDRITRRLIISGQICGYCHGKPELVDSTEIYGEKTFYGKFWMCKPCNAYVGVHRGTDTPLGRLANAPLRAVKKEAHRYFDVIWKRLISDKISKNMARGLAYKWLSEQMNLPIEETHIGMFDEDQCWTAIYYSQQVL